MKRLLVCVALVSGVIAGCSEGEIAQATPSRNLESEEVPWSLSVPPGWHASTERSRPDPRMRVGVLRTYIANTAFGFDFDRAIPGPNAGAGASRSLGDSAVVVFVQLLWYPADRPVVWRGSSDGTTSLAWVGQWNADAQNPGWRFRERKLCSGSQCVQALEWHGPSATGQDVEQAEEVASSIQLDPGWTDA